MDGGRPPLPKPDSVAEFSRLHTLGADAVTGEPDHFGLGFETRYTRYPFLGPEAFGHGGAAGSPAFADPRSGVAYAYIRRRFSHPGGPAPENARPAAAVLRAAAAARQPAGCRLPGPGPAGRQPAATSRPESRRRCPGWRWR